MKVANESIFLEDGEWWYHQPSGTRQRAAVVSCVTCSEKFLTFPAGRQRRQFCSPECWRRACERCGKMFQPVSNRNSYCSLACKRGIGKCEQCGKKYMHSHHGAKRFCSLSCFYEYTCPIGHVIEEGGGYTLTKVPPGTPGSRRGGGRTLWMLTHRYVMQKKLGRPLLKTEHVHHMNGKKADNRPENLELWKKAHPRGVRSADYHCPGCRCFEHRKIARIPRLT